MNISTVNVKRYGGVYIWIGEYTEVGTVISPAVWAWCGGRRCMGAGPGRGRGTVCMFVCRSSRLLLPIIDRVEAARPPAPSSPARLRARQGSASCPRLQGSPITILFKSCLHNIHNQREILFKNRNKVWEILWQKLPLNKYNAHRVRTLIT